MREHMKPQLLRLDVPSNFPLVDVKLIDHAIVMFTPQ